MLVAPPPPPLAASAPGAPTQPPLQGPPPAYAAPPPAYPPWGGHLNAVHHEAQQGSHAARDIVIVVIVLVVAIVAILAVLAASGLLGGGGPPHGFAGTTTGANCVWTPFSYTFPNNAQVRFVWIVQGGSSQELTVTGPSGMVYDQTGSSGSGSFTSASGAYYFSGTSCTNTTIQVSGLYT